MKLRRARGGLLNIAKLHLPAYVNIGAAGSYSSEYLKDHMQHTHDYRI